VSGAPIRALVTAGGTAEPVDDVRVLTNRSTGRFGAAIANALAANGVEVTLLGSEGLYARQLPLHGSIRQVRFESTAQLADALAAGLAEGQDLVFMAAAVSDYRPEAAEGKISSKAAERTLRLTRTPKLLDTLRSACPEAYLIGFKLLSGVSRDELTRVARGQIERASLDLCVANDLQELGGPTHPVLLVDAEVTLRVEGPRQRVAERLVRHALSRAGHPPQPWRESPAPEGLSGQVLVGAGAQLRPVPQLSSDEPLEASLARALRSGQLSLPLPPGGRAFRRGGADLLLLAEGAAFLDGLRARSEAWRSGPGRELAARLGAPLLFRPILEGSEVRGLLAEGPLGLALDGPLPALTEGSSEAWAEDLLASLSSEPRVWVRDSRELMASRAFVPREAWEGWTCWSGPALREDLRRGASICLLAPASQRVLLGRRAKAPAEGCWAFPGGGREEGESAWESALRELREEAGVALAARPAERHDVFHGEAGRAYHVEGFVALSLDEAPLTSNGELTELGWYPLSEALGLRPITPGTLRVLRDLDRRR
jgi:8-oxo-dGTP pyrophosphatase MutT (NUDIX family)